eukprot:Platyproteum_vivax@DN4323_c0_g1_i1.p1
MARDGVRLSSTVSLTAGKFNDLMAEASPPPTQENDTTLQLHGWQPSPHSKASLHSLAGASGALLAMTIVYPLDNLRTRLQVSRRHGYGGILRSLDDIFRDEGIKGLYAGLRSALIGVGCSWAIYYYFYSYFQSRFGSRNSKKLQNNSLRNLLISVGSGILSAILTNPIWVVNTRMKLRQNKNVGFFRALRELYIQEGISGLMSGAVPSLVLVSNPAIQFVAYEKLKVLLVKFKQLRASRLGRREHAAWKRNPTNQDLSSMQYFVIGGLAKLIATMATYPQQVVKARLQAKPAVSIDGSGAYGGTVDCILKIIQQEGFGGLYRGMLSKMIATVLNSAIMFMSVEKLLIIFVGILKKISVYNQKRLQNASAV